MSLSGDCAIISNSDILSEDYIPSIIRVKENQTNEIILLLAPAIRGIKHTHIRLCGKTATARFILKKLTEDHRILYGIVKEKKEIDSRRLWEAYQERCSEMRREPIALRTFSVYMNRLAQAGLIITEDHGGK